MAHLAQNVFKVNKGIRYVKLVFVLILTCVFFITAFKIRNLQITNEALILRNDSLHIQQLQSKLELARIQKRYDSLLKKKFIASP